MKVMLIGNPNVGKSVLFSHLTGVNVVASNYPGTTVEFARGKMRVDGQSVEVYDVPGTYSLQPTCPAEEVALRLMEQADVVVNVLDATRLERNLYLTLQLTSSGKPLVIVLNMWDEARHTGVHIDTERLSNLLGVPVVTTCALTGEGLADLRRAIKIAKTPIFSPKNDIWSHVGRIISDVQRIEHRHHTLLERLADACMHPMPGIPLAVLILAGSFFIVRLIGESLISYIMDPMFEHLWRPVVEALSNWLGGTGFWHDILVGQLVPTESGPAIDFTQSFGLLSTGLYVPFGAVLPYIFAFYLVLSFLEDLGYLPRLGVLLDTLLHRLGMHGLGVIPMLLGLGCNVPGALATRVLESKRERFIAATLMAVAVPCMAQISVIAGLAAMHGVGVLVAVAATLFALWIAGGYILNLLLPGESPEMITEIPPYRLPHLRTLLKKVWMRIRWFLREAVPFVLAGVLLVNILYSVGVLDWLGRMARPLVSGLMGLPERATAAMLIGFLRKDVAVGMLAPLNLNAKQTVIASVVLCVYFPCVATFIVLLRELGWRLLVVATAIMVTTAVAVATLLNAIL